MIYDGQSLGGALDSMHFALGERDVIIVVDLPDTVAAAALGASVAASGLVSTRATALLTVAEMDQALTRSPAYRGRVAIGPSGCRASEIAAQQVLSLPVHPELTDAQVAQVCEALRQA